MRLRSDKAEGLGLRRSLLCLCAIAILPAHAVAEDATPANTLAGLSRQFSACMAPHSLGPAGSRMTIAFAMRRDGSILGKPRVSFSHLEGDAPQREAFVAAVERAVSSCLPLKVTPALGAAIAGRIFTITLGREGPRA
jgi:hypothetical protein